MLVFSAVISTTARGCWCWCWCCAVSSLLTLTWEMSLIQIQGAVVSKPPHRGLPGPRETRERQLANSLHVSGKRRLGSVSYVQRLRPHPAYPIAEQGIGNHKKEFESLESEVRKMGPLETRPGTKQERPDGGRRRAEASPLHVSASAVIRHVSTHWVCKLGISV